MEGEPKRPWWRRKRVWAAGLLWCLLAGYPLGAWPVGYAIGRGWLPDAAVRLYRPMFPTGRAIPGQGPPPKVIPDQGGGWRGAFARYYHRGHEAGSDERLAAFLRSRGLAP